MIEIDWGLALAELLVVLVLLAAAMVRGLRARGISVHFQNPFYRKPEPPREVRGCCALCLTPGQVLHVRDKQYGPLCIACVDAVHRMRSGLRVQGK